MFEDTTLENVQTTAENELLKLEQRMQTERKWLVGGLVVSFLLGLYIGKR